MPVNHKAASHFLSVELFFLWCLILDQNSWRESAMLSQSPVRCPNPQFTLCNLLTAIVTATACRHSDLLPTSYNRREKKGETPVLTELELRGVFMAGEDVRHLQSILALCGFTVIVSVCLRELVCVCVYVCKLLIEWFSFFLSGLANFLLVCVCVCVPFLCFSL